MSTDKGYIKLYRDIRDHWIYSERPISKFQAWIDLILEVNHEDKKIMFDGQPVVVRRGSTITSLRKLSLRWGWSKDSVARFLDILEKEGMISQMRDTKKTLINVEKYAFYQDSSSKSATQKRHRADTDRDTGRDTDRNKQGTKGGTKEGTKKKGSPSGEYDPLAGRRRRHDDDL